MEEEDK